jgi:hypothetical protein
LRFLKLMNKVIENIITILKCLHEYINVFTKSFGDYLWIGWWSIFDTKKHYNPYKSPSINNKGGLVLVFWCYEYLRASKKTILKCINLMFGYSIIISSIKGNMYGSFFVAALSFLKSTHICSNFHYS